jgi:FlaA1/EpsC-like NDP-sugar epimerase
MVRSLGNRETKTRYIGMRPGEKMHEALVCRQESLRAFTHGDYYVILPTMDVRGVYSKWRGCEYVNQEYTSEHNRFLTQEEIYETLQKDSWLNPVPVSALEHFTKEELLDFFRKEGWAR